MKAVIYNFIETYARDTVDFLAANEARNNLLLGLIEILKGPRPLWMQEEPFMVTIKNDTNHVVLAAIRTPPYNLVVSAGEKEAVSFLAQYINNISLSLPGVIGPDDHGHTFAQAWTTVSGESYQPGMGQLVYQLTEVTPLTAPGIGRLAEPRDLDLLYGWSLAFAEEARGIGRVIREQVRRRIERGGYMVWEHDGLVVSFAGYGGQTPNGMRIGPVYTPPENRRKGYAGALVSRVSEEVLAMGCQFVFLFTDKANPTSNKLYQRIGFKEVCGFDEWKLIAEKQPQAMDHTS